MNSNWRNRPTMIDYVPEGIDYVISIDESGSSDLRQVLKARRNNVPPVDSEKHFVVTACAFSVKDLPVARDMVMELKYKYWKEGLFQYKDKEKRVCFHSREIRNKREAFNPELIDYTAFITDLSKLMSEVHMTLYVAHIDKVRHINKYSHPDSPYDLCMTFVLERIMQDIGRNKNCIIILEARGAREDKELLRQIKCLIDYGNQYHRAEDFSRIKGVYFNPKWSKRDSEKKSYWELELADLCAYPMQKYFNHGKRDKAFETLLPKISCYPNYRGRGLKSFP